MLRTIVDVGAFRYFLPQSLHHPLHVIVIIRKNCYLSLLVVVNAHTTLRAVVHGQSCGFHLFQGLIPNINYF